MMNVFNRLSLLIFLLQLAFISSAQIMTGHATHFERLGTPFGGCGVPTENVDSDAFVALNVFNRPNTGPNDFERPISPENQSVMGEFQNGRNCGRWVKVSILEDCVGGPNSGQLGQGFCNEGNARYENDRFSGAVQYMVVADACGDNNGWCRDDLFHLDLHTSAVNTFEIDGQPVNNMLETAFNNRMISWEYVRAPDYSGDIKIHFMEDSFQWWASIFITNLENGIHGVQQLIDGEWVNLQMNSDLGQAYLLQRTELFTFTIRVLDADDELINNQREYTFDFPSSCEDRCIPPATQVDYTVNNNPILNVAEEKEIAFSIYPNPTSDKLFIDNLQDRNWVLYNSIGDVTLEGGKAIINMNSLASGIYFLEVGNNRVKVVKSN